MPYEDEASASNSPNPSVHDAVDSLVHTTVEQVDQSTSKHGDIDVTEGASEVEGQIISQSASIPDKDNETSPCSEPSSSWTELAPAAPNIILPHPFQSGIASALTSFDPSFPIFPPLAMNNSTPFDLGPKQRWSLAGVNGSPTGSMAGPSDVGALRGRLDYLQDQLQLLTLKNREMTANYKSAVGELESRRQMENDIKSNSQRLQSLSDTANHEKQLLQQQVLQMKMRLDIKADEVNELKGQVDQLRSQRGAPFDAPSWADDLLKQWEQVHKDNEILRQENDMLREQAHMAEERHRDIRHNMQLMLEEQRVEQEKHRSEMMGAYEELHKLAQDRDVMRGRCDAAMLQRDEARIECNKYQVGKQRSEEQAENFLSKYHESQEEYIQVMSERDSVLKENQEVSEQKDLLEKRLKTLTGENASLLQQLQCSKQKSEGEFNNTPSHQSLLSSEEEVADITRAALDKENTELHVVLQAMKGQIKTQRNEICEARSNRDWALSERERVVSERESMRAMCDQLRRERDEAITRLADAIKDTDDLHRQREEAQRQLQMCKEQIESRDQTISSPSHSRDSAIDSDMAEWDIETIELNLPDSKNDDLGLEIRGGCDDPMLGTNVPIYVKNVEKGSKLDGKLRTFDCISQLNDIDVSNMEHKAVMDILYKCNSVKMVVKRRRLVGMKLISVPIDSDSVQTDCGIVFEDGIHISKIKTGSAGAKAGNLAVGDRLVYINDVPVEGKSSVEVNNLVRELHKNGSGVVLAVMKSPPVLSPITPSTSFGTSISSSSSRRPPQTPQEETLRHKPKQSSKLLDMVHDKIFGKDKKSTVKASACIQNIQMQSSDAIRHARSGSNQSQFSTLTPSSLRSWNIYSTMQGRRNSAFAPTARTNKAGGGNGTDETWALNQLDNVLKDADSTPTKESTSKTAGSSPDKGCGGTWPKYRQNAVNEEGSVASTFSQRPKKISPRKSVFPVFPAIEKPCEGANAQPMSSNQPHSSGSVVVERGLRHNSPRMHPSPRPLTYHPTVSSARISVPPLLPLSARTQREPSSAISPPPYSDRTGSRHSSSDHSRFSMANRADYAYVHPANGVHAQLVTQRHNELQLYARCVGNGSGSKRPNQSNYVPPPPYPGSNNYSKQSNYEELIDCDLDVRSITSQSSGSVATGLGDIHGLSNSSSIHGTPRHNSNSRRHPIGGVPYALPNPGTASPFRPLSSDFSNTRLSVGEVRNIFIEKGSSCEFLGIKVLDNIKGQGIFVSEVNKNSLASKNGVLVGDQILDVCGINMRKADIRAAKHVLRQLGRSEQITLTVQFNPAGGDRSAGVSTSLDWHSTSSTPTAFAKGKGLLSRESSTHSNATHSREMLASISECEPASEPRPAMIRKEGDTDWGFTLIGGNAMGIFVDEIRQDSSASGPEGLRVGDRILEFNGINFRKLTLEQAMYELQRTCDEDVFVLAQQNMKKLQECKRGGPGDSFYIRVNVDRPTDNQDELPLKQGDIVYVDKTVFMGEPGRWRAWRLDQEARERSCGIIPSKYKLEEEFLMKRSGSEISSGDAGSEGGGSRRGTIRRSLKFMRRSSRSSQHHQRTPSKESKDQLDSDTVPFLDDLYQRVERLDDKRKRPVVLVGALSHMIVHKLVENHPNLFAQCVPECVKAPANELEQGLHSGLYVEFSKRDQLFQVTTVAAVKEIMDKGYHCLLDVSPCSLERMHRLQMYPVVIVIKFKHAKQVKELSDLLGERVPSKNAKEMIEKASGIESRLTDINYQTCIVSVSPQQQSDNTVRLLCQQILSAIEQEQKKTLWIISNDTI